MHPLYRPLLIEASVLREGFIPFEETRHAENGRITGMGNEKCPDRDCSFHMPKCPTVLQRRDLLRAVVEQVT